MFTQQAQGVYAQDITKIRSYKTVKRHDCSEKVKRQSGFTF